MAITQLEPAILFDSNIFLVTGDRNVLIDTGTGFKVEDTIREIRKVLGKKRLDTVVITHRHYDHVGGLRGIIKEFSPKVYAGTLDAVPLREGDSESTMGTSFGGTIDKMTVEDLEEGDVIDTGEHKLSVIETPGHTSGSISLSDQVTGALFTGDTVFADGIGRYDLPTASKDQLIKSLQRLSGLDINGFYPGHGPSVQRGGKEYVERGLRMIEGMQ